MRGLPCPVRGGRRGRRPCGCRLSEILGVYRHGPFAWPCVVVDDRSRRGIGRRARHGTGGVLSCGLLTALTVPIGYV